jgi:retron-type reverse transcriptase
MGQKHKHLFDQITDPDNLWKAYRKASRGKRSTMGYLLFKQDDGANLSSLRQRLMDGSYTPGKPRTFMVFEPKPREISALPFTDRVAQHALCNIIEPIFDRVFLPQSYACRTGKGTHAAANAVQAMLRRQIAAGREPWVLKTDFSRYFASVRRDVLHAELARKISCKRTLDLLRRFIPADGCGLPIGNLTSQLSANVYGHAFDRWLVHQVGVTRFARYMDDVVVIGLSREAMALLQMQARGFAQASLGLRFSHWSVQHWRRGVNFCGYRIWPTHKLLRKSSVTRARRKLREFAASGDTDARSKFLAAWLGHAGWADSHNLVKKLGVSA